MNRVPQPSVATLGCGTRFIGYGNRLLPARLNQQARVEGELLNSVKSEVFGGEEVAGRTVTCLL